MRYEGAVYRPPSEAGSLIIQLTIGCARNTCRFCSMFKDKKFRVRKLEDVVADLKEMREYYKDYLIRRIFLADGDALICKTEDLLYIMGVINELFPERERITMYGAPKDVLLTSHEELVKLREAGLVMVYVGAESGDDEVLEYVKKGATHAEIAEAGLKLKAAGIAVSSGADMVIANGNDIDNIAKIMSGADVGTLFVSCKDENFDLVKFIG